MAKYELKTKITDVAVTDFLATVENETRYNDAIKILEMMTEITGEEPKMWGPSIIGFGEYHYKYASGHEGDMCKIGFSPRKDALSIYAFFEKEKKEELLAQLGKHKMGKACLYIKKLSDINETVLREIFERGYKNFSLEY